jgi:lipopolysaccharide transport system ATP-binding protein
MFHIRRDVSHPSHDKFIRLENDDALMACIEGRANIPGVLDMIQITQSWIQSDADFFLITYEHLLEDPMRELVDSFIYLGLPVENEMIRTLVERNRFARHSIGRKFWKRARQSGQADPNSHLRKGVAGDWRNYFKPSHVECFKNCAGKQLIELGYETGFDW